MNLWYEGDFDDNLTWSLRGGPPRKLQVRL